MLRVLDASALPTSREPSRAGWLTLDLEQLTALPQAQDLLDPVSLKAIYCIAGMTNVEACEDNAGLAFQVNAKGPGILARYARNSGLPFVYFSTEYIFDGQSGPYVEVDQPHPISVYGASKLAGEGEVLDAHPEALILRTTVVYGPDDRQKNFIYSLLSALTSGRVMKVAKDQISTPTYNRDLVHAAVRLQETGSSGIFHVCGPERLSRFDFAQRAANYLGLDAGLLAPVSTADLRQRAPRPLSAGLATDKLMRLHPQLGMRSLEEALDDCAAELHLSKLQQNG